MRRLSAALMFLFLLSLPLAAHASTVEYSVSGNLSQGSTYSGFFIVTTGQYSSPITSLDITVSGVGADVFDGDAGDADFGSSATYAQVKMPSGTLFYLAVTPAPGGGYTVCTDSNETGGCAGIMETGEVDLALQSYQNPATSGIAAAVSPEPSSLALLGTGVLGLAGAVRRRIVKA